MGKGKSGGKIVFSILGFALGGVLAGFTGVFGHAAGHFVIGAAFTGMSIASTLWSVTKKPKINDYDIPDVKSTVRSICQVVETFPERCSFAGIQGEWTDRIWAVIKTLLIK